MRTPYGLCLALASCFAPALPALQPCAPGGDCPGDQACVPSATGKVCVDPAADSDGDGVPDNIDNCLMVANPDQDNEDGDAFGDLCDPCPPYPEADPIADADGDGISDRCDPHPTVPGDTIAVFDGFDHGAPAGATLVGPWTFGAGRATIVSAVDTRNHVSWPLPGTGSETIMTFVTVDAIVGTSISRAFGVTDELDVATERSVACEYERNGGDVETLEIIDTGTASVLDSVAAPLSVGQSASFAETRAGKAYTCQSNSFAPLSASSPFAPTGGRIGIRTRSISAHFDWVLIVKSP